MAAWKALLRLGGRTAAVCGDGASVLRKKCELNQNSLIGFQQGNGLRMFSLPCKVEEWSDTPYMEYIVGLQAEASGSAPGCTLSEMRKKRPEPEYMAKLVRLRIENASQKMIRASILEDKRTMRDFGKFWIPMLSDLLAGDFHHYSLEVFQWLITNPMVLTSARMPQLERMYAMMISYAGVVGKLKLARSWFDDMERKGVKHSTACCNALMIAYAKNGDMKTARTILDGMKSCGQQCPPNALTYYILVSMYIRHNDWLGVREMLKDCRVSNIPLDVRTYTTLLRAYAKAGNLFEFEKTYSEAKARKKKARSEEQEIFSTLLAGYSRLNALDKVETLIEDGRRGRFLIELPAAEEIAMACSRNGSVQPLKKLLDVVESKPEFVPNWIFQSYVVEAYVKSGELDEAELYIRSLCREKKDFIAPPAFELVIDAFVKRGVEEPQSSAFETIQKMYCRVKEAGFWIAPSTYEALISQLARNKHYDIMEEIALDMEEPGVKWPSKTLRVLLEAYEESGNKEKMAQVSERLKEAVEREEAGQRVKEAPICTPASYGDAAAC